MSDKECEHTEHALGGRGMLGRYFEDWKIGGAGKWELCRVETDRFYGIVRSVNDEQD